jgi:hypothetical protein
MLPGDRWPMLRTFLLALAFTVTIPLLAQHHPSPPAMCTPPEVSDITGQGCHLPTPEEVRRQKDREKALAHQRFLEMQRDTDKLFELASQLKKEVDAAGQDTLSVDVIKKAESIEKLAKSVKQKMKGD